MIEKGRKSLEFVNFPPLKCGEPALMHVIGGGAVGSLHRIDIPSLSSLSLVYCYREGPELRWECCVVC